MTEALRDKILLKKQGVSQSGRQLLGTSDSQSDAGVSQLPNEINHLVRRSFMFHYRVFGCLGAAVAGGHYHNLLHFVHKLLHALVPGE
jgi:hypothetical protein